jgi:hypothetical protein
MRNSGKGRLEPFFFTIPLIYSPIHFHWLLFLPVSWRLTSGIITIKKMVSEERIRKMGEEKKSYPICMQSTLISEPEYRSRAAE